MKTFKTTAGTEFFFTNKYLQYGNRQYPYKSMENLAHRKGDNPLFIFDCEGERVKIPYRQQDKGILLQYFRKISYELSQNSPEDESISRAVQNNVDYLKRFEDVKAGVAEDRRIRQLESERKKAAQRSGHYDREDYFRDYIGKHSEKYLHKFSQPFSWNWCSFFVTPYWLMYRRMFIPAFIYYATFVLTAFVGTKASDIINSVVARKFAEMTAASEVGQELADVSQMSYAAVIAGYLPFFILAVVWGLLGNKLYKGYVERAYDSEDRVETIDRKGGTKKLNILLAILLMGIISTIVFNFIMVPNINIM